MSVSHTSYAKTLVTSTIASAAAAAPLSPPLSSPVVDGVKDCGAKITVMIDRLDPEETANIPKSKYLEDLPTASVAVPQSSPFAALSTANFIQPAQAAPPAPFAAVPQGSPCPICFSSRLHIRTSSSTTSTTLKPLSTTDTTSNTDSNLEAGQTCPCNDSVQEAKKRKLVRKLDIRLFPCLLAMCLFQAMDRGSIGIAKINGVQDDLKINQSQFNLALSIFRIGYGLFQIPSNLLIVHPRVHPGIYLTVTCLAWSISGLCHAFVQDYTQLLIVRFLLGMFDAPYFVGAAFLLSCWYTKREMAMRLAIMLVGLVFMLTFLGPIAVGIIEGLDGMNGWKGWRWIYLILVSSGLGIAVWGWVMLPGRRLDASQDGDRGSGKGIWWLSEEEYEFARRRIEEDRVGEQKAEKGKLWGGFQAAIMDIRVWVFVVMIMCRKSFDGLWNYEFSIYQSLHLITGSTLSENTQALQLSMGPALFAALVTLLMACPSDRRSERSIRMIVPLLLAAAASTVIATTLHPAVRYAMLFLIAAGGLSGLAMAWAWVTSTVQETPEKKAVAIAIVNVLGGVGAIYGPFFFREGDAPGYRLAFGLLAGCAMVDAICVFVMRRVLQQNRSLKGKARTESVQGGERLYAL